ncbi:DUF6177 family protein [Streptomyces sp. NPDC051643]|uniref:DUF6177 family protein n=1 Tax=Streptomyces sp. NPDC051643 TaxID=3365665 RepID=UPI00379E965B
MSDLIESLVVKHNLAAIISELRAGRPVLTTPAYYELPPIPVSFSLGPDAVADFGISHAPPTALCRLTPTLWNRGPPVDRLRPPDRERASDLLLCLSVKPPPEPLHYSSEVRQPPQGHASFSCLASAPERPI